jgi:hypothetical protein
MAFQDPMGLPSDTTLLLRVYAEHRWLAEELTDLVERVESRAFTVAGETPTEPELRAAMAALQELWSEGRRRAAHTDRAFQTVAVVDEDDAPWLVRQTCSYYRWLCELRDSLATRVEPFVRGVGGIADAA